MTRQHPDPYLLGVDEPTLLVPAHLAVILWPAVTRFVREHEQQGATGKLKALESLLYRWNHLVQLHRMTSDGFTREPADGATAADGGRSSRPEGHWLTADQVAKRLGCTPQHVTRLARRGDLDANDRTGRWLIDEASVATLEAARRTA